MKNIQVVESAISLRELCKEILPLPSWAVLIGMASDLPVLMDVLNPNTPNIVIWDRQEGQGNLIAKTAIEFVSQHSIIRVELVVLSNRARDWKKANRLVGGKGECVAIVPFWDETAERVLSGLATWCGFRSAISPVILFVDGIENMEEMSKEAQKNFQAVLSLGQNRNVYVIGTAKSENRERASKWLCYFKTEIFGTENIRWFEMDERNNEIVFFAPITDI